MSRPQEPDGAPSALIVGHGVVTVGDRGPGPAPGRALVYSDRNGTPVARSRPSMFEAFQYQNWYVVDMARHTDTITGTVPSRYDAMRFQLEADVTWGVTAPDVVVGYALDDGLEIVKSWLIERFWQVTRRYDINDCNVAEVELQGMHMGRSVPLEEGITIFKVAVRLHIDERTADFQHRRRGLEHTAVIERQNAELERERLEALRRTVKGEDDMLFLFLDRHPDQVGQVLQMVAQRRDLTEQARMALVEKMVDKKIIREVDLERMRDWMLRPLEQMVDPNAHTSLGAPAAPAVPPVPPLPPPPPLPAAKPDANDPPPVPAPPEPPPPPQPSAPPPAQAPAAQAPARPPTGNGVTGWKSFGQGSKDPNS